MQRELLELLVNSAAVGRGVQKISCYLHVITWIVCHGLFLISFFLDAVSFSMVSCITCFQVVCVFLIWLSFNFVVLGRINGWRCFV